MANLLTISAQAAPFPRSVLKGTGQSVELDLVVELDGSPVTITTPTAVLKTGTTTIASYSLGSGIVVSGGTMTLTIPSTDLTSNQVLFEHLWLAWDFLANGKPERKGERLLVTDQLLRAACRVQDITRLHRALQDPENYHPDHLASSSDPGWGYVGEDTWRDLRLDLWQEFPHLEVDQLRSPEPIRRVHKHMWAAEVYSVVAGDRGQGSYFAGEAERHAALAEYYLDKLRVWIRDSSSTEHPDEPVIDNIEAEGPYWMHDEDPNNEDGFI